MSYSYREWVAMSLLLLWAYALLGAVAVATNAPIPYLRALSLAGAATMFLVQASLDVYSEYLVLGRFVYLICPMMYLPILSAIINICIT